MIRPHSPLRRFAAGGRRWAGRYPGADSLSITADGGGSDGPRNRLWEVSIQALADTIGLRIGVCHVPPGTSEWNKIEHRMSCPITKDWRGRPLTVRAVVVNLIGSTMTETGLEIHAELDESAYPTGITVTDEELAEVRLRRNQSRGEWNSTISPSE